MKWYLLVLVTIVLFSCNSKTDPAKLAEIKQKGNEISNQAQATLLANVGKAIQKGGPEYAVEFCNLKVSSKNTTDIEGLTVSLTIKNTGKVKGKSQLQSLLDFSLNEFGNLYENKVRISKSNLVYADQCWHVFAENNYEKLQEFNFNKSKKFAYFQLAINQHLKRFSDEKGLNEIDYKILETINNEALTENEIVRNLLIIFTVINLHNYV